MDPKAAQGEAEASDDLQSLEEQGDLETLLSLARAYRTGDAGRPKDMKACYAAYRSAANLGSADAAYAVALFHFSGGAVEKDPTQALSFLRAAAEAGHVQGRVYLANLYECGTHYKLDAEKAGVWYRSAARAAGVTAEPETPEYAEAMAELGAGRYVQSADIPEARREVLQRKARALGFGVPSPASIAARPSSDPGVPAERISALPGDAPAAAGRPTPSPAQASATPARAPAPALKEKLAELEEKAPKPSSLTLAEGLVAFFFALLFFAAGAGAGYAAQKGGDYMLSQGQPVPVFGHETQLLFPAAVALVGILPSFLFYRAGTVLRSIVGAAIGAGVGWVLWGTGVLTFVTSRVLQTTALGVGGFLLFALAFGIFGGAKKKPRPEDARL
jgi:hypothetical protein